MKEELSGKIIKSINQINSPENKRRLNLQTSLNNYEKIFSFNSWSYGVGISKPGNQLKEIALSLGKIDEKLASLVINLQLENQHNFFNSSISDIPFSTQIFTNMGLSWLYRLSPLGEKYKVLAETGAFINTPVLEESLEEWKKLPQPHLHINKELHEERMSVFSKLIDERFTIYDDMLPLPLGSVFGEACRLRGDSELLMDFRLCPDTVKAFMNYLTKSTMLYNHSLMNFYENDPWFKTPNWENAFNMFIFHSFTSLGGKFMYLAGEDHISNNMFSEKDYLDFVFPYQKEIVKSFPMWYVHSCGNLTPFFKHIKTLPNLHRVHVSPWSDLETAVDCFENSVILELHQSLDFDDKSANEIDFLADNVFEICSGRSTVDIVLPDNDNGIRYKNRILKRSGQGT